VIYRLIALLPNHSKVSQAPFSLTVLGCKDKHPVSADQRSFCCYLDAKGATSLKTQGDSPSRSVGLVFILEPDWILHDSRVKIFFFPSTEKYMGILSLTCNPSPVILAGASMYSLNRDG